MRPSTVAGGYMTLELNETARAATRGQLVDSWPDRERASGHPWNDLFRDFAPRYDGY